MKHNIKITIILLAMFFASQLIGIGVINAYSPQINIINETINTTSYNLPYGMEPPQDITPGMSLTSIITAIVIAVLLMLLLMKLKAEIFLRLWFFLVVILALAITFNAPLFKFTQYSSIIAFLVALPIAYVKVFKRHIPTHNASELFIYPGIAAIFVPLLNIWAIVILLVLISIYDMYAVWHAGFMQKMAHYQIKKVKVFAGLFVPYLNDKQRAMIQKLKASKSKTKSKKMKVNVAILGGGDIVFPMILAGVVLHTFGFLPALIIAIGATAALATLFSYSQKGKFYPAMPFITAGCFIALGLVYLLF